MTTATTIDVALPAVSPDTTRPIHRLLTQLYVIPAGAVLNAGPNRAGARSNRSLAADLHGLAKALVAEADEALVYFAGCQQKPHTILSRLLVLCRKLLHNADRLTSRIGHDDATW
jgi:hypothetical protein